MLCAILALHLSDDLVLRPAPGDLPAMGVTMTITEDGGSSVTVQGTMRQRIVTAGPDGFSIASEFGDVILKVGGQEIASADRQQRTMRFGPNGALLSLEGKNSGANAYRIAAATNFVVPGQAVEPGANWSWTAPGPGKCKLDYRFVGPEKVGAAECRKITFEGKEATAAGLASKGEFWIDPSSGRIVKLKATLENAPLKDKGKPVKIELLQEAP